MSTRPFKLSHSETKETYWGDPSGNIHRMSGEQEIVATVTPSCSDEEYRLLCDVKIVEWKSDE